jgi:hypothetical protein
MRLQQLIRGIFQIWVAAVFIAAALAQTSANQTSSSGAGSAQTQSKPQSPASAASPAPKPSNGKESTASNIPGFDREAGIPVYETIQEDWSNLQIGVSKLKPEPPIVGSVDDEQKFTRQLVSVQWRPGDPIDLWISIPKGVKKPPVVLYLYDYSEDTDRFRNNAWCERTTGGGAAAVGFVSALSGPRFHSRPMRQWFVSELQESLGSTVHDVKFILDYLASRGDLDMNRVGMFGAGAGGTIAILAAAADPRIKAIDVMEPWGDWPVFLKKTSLLQLDPVPENKDNYGKPEFLKKVEPLDPVKYLPQLKIPVRMQQIQDTDVVPIESKEALKDALPKQAQLRRFDTVMTMFHQERGGVLYGWLAEQMKALSPPDASGQKAASVMGSEASGQASSAPSARPR